MRRQVREGKQIMVEEKSMNLGGIKVGDKYSVMQHPELLIPGKLLGTDKANCTQILRERNSYAITEVEVLVSQQEEKIERGKANKTEGQQILVDMGLQTQGQHNKGQQDLNQDKSPNTAIEAFSSDLEINGDERDRVNLGDSEDFMDSQDTEDNFAKQLGISLPEDDTESQEDEKRRSKRLRDKEDKKPQEMAMHRKETKNAFVNKEIGGKTKKITAGCQTLKAGGK